MRKAVSLARSTGRLDVAWSVEIARYAGLRIEETTALTKTQFRDALRNGFLSLRITKGGIPRDVSLLAPVHRVFREMLETTDRGGRLFIGNGNAHHQAYKSVTTALYCPKTDCI